MIVSIQTRCDNALKLINCDAKELRQKRMSRKLSFFFDLIKTDSRFAKNNKSKGKYMPVFITLTYREQKLWDKRDISALLAKYRKHFTSGGKKAKMPLEDFRYVWVAELQKRGVIHYHICIWLPRFMRLRDLKPDEMGWWEHGFSNVTAVKKSVFAYLKKYLGKTATKGLDSEGNTIWHTFPKGARIYGAGGLTRLERVRTAYKLLPQWIKGIFKDDTTPIRRELGGFRQNKTMVMSPYECYDVVTPFNKYKEIIYKKKWSLIEDKTDEIIWDDKVNNDHEDTQVSTICSVITNQDLIWAEFNCKATMGT